MALKVQLMKWKAALDSFDNQEFETSLVQFKEFSNMSKIQFNMGMIAAKLQYVSEALDGFDKAIQMDSYFSLAYFQRGIILYLNQDPEGALENFQDCYDTLRKNTHINYNQLGLDYVLHECFIIFNISLCLLLMGDTTRGLRYLQESLRLGKESPENPGMITVDVDIVKIEHGIRLGMDAPTKVHPFQVSEHLLFRPQEDNIKNITKIDYLGTSKIVAGANANDDFSGFSGRQIKEMTLGRNYRKEKEPKTNPLPMVPENIIRRNETVKTSSLNRYNTTPNTNVGIRTFSRTKSSNSSPTVLPMRTSSVPNENNTVQNQVKVTKTNSEKSFQSFDSSDSKSGREHRLYTRENVLYTDTDRKSNPVQQNSKDNTFVSKSDLEDTRSHSESISSSIPGNMKIKIYGNGNDIRMLLLPQDILYNELIEKVRFKFKNPNLFCKFLDESGRKTVMTNDDDLDEALEYASVPNRLELWTFENK